MRKIAVALLMINLLFGCVAKSSIDSQELAEKAAPVFGASFLVFHVPSSGALSDETFITLSKSTGTSALAKQLYKQVSKAVATDVKIAVGGPNSRKTAVVISNALGLNNDKLAHLSLLFIGDQKDAEKVEAAVESVDGKFYFNNDRQ